MTAGCTPASTYTRIVVDVHELSEWQNGDRVFAPWEHELLYPGTVLFIDEDVAFVRFDDGDRAIIPLDELRSVGIQIGNEVFCRRERDVLYYHTARVLGVSDDGLKVRYMEDGATDLVPISFCRLPARR